jgi:hypothetical protein
MKIDGRCHCGRITYEAELDPATVSVCHCTDCQTLSGSPWRASIRVAAGDLRFTGAQPRIYVKVAESGARRAQGFCENCGTPIYAADEHAPAAYNLRIGAIVQRDQLRPYRQIWRRSALSWSCDLTSLPASPVGPG